MPGHWFSQKIKIKQSSIPLRSLGAILVLFILVPTAVPSPAQARTFNPHRIITDQELFDKDAVSQTAIQVFLEREGSVLARYSQIVNGQAKKASAIIWEIGQRHNVNPKFLLTTLEKEQALISNSQATEKALDWATGYSCFGGTCNEKHRGFYNQLDATAETQLIYQERAGQFAFRTGQTTTTFDGYAVTPENQATANLYIYTPYVGHSPELGIISRFGANRLFWRIWHRYFSNQKFLDGQIITRNGAYWRIEKNTKRLFASRAILLADYQESDAIAVSSKDLAAYPDGAPISFANNTLVKSAASGQLFLLDQNLKRPIIDNAALAFLTDLRIALEASDVPSVAETMLDEYGLGPLISTASVFPQGKLFKDASGALWQVKDGLKHTVDQVVWQKKFNQAPTETVNANDLEKYPTGAPVKLPDGTFVAANGNYYLISSGERMKIDDPAIFDRVFGASRRINTLSISTALLEIHSAGEIIDYINDTIADPPPGTAASNPSSFAAQFASMHPDGLIMITGQEQAITVQFKNTGGTTWNSTNVWLTTADRGGNSSLFHAPEKSTLNESSVGNGSTGSFTITLTAPTDQSGILNQEFTLWGGEATNPVKLAAVAKFIIVKAGVSAQILEHNIPLAVRNTWRPITIKIKIKNTSADTAWLSRRTALELYTASSETSPFYDPADWVRREVVGVPLNKSTIASGETGEFIFTLDPRGVSRGNHILNFQLRLLDQDGKQVFIDGRDEWHREIRVD